MPLTLTKKDYTRFLICPAYAWLAKHKPELVPAEKDEAMRERRFALGDRIERYALSWYPQARTAEGYGEAGAAATRKLMDGGAEVIYQATAISPEGYQARTDLLIQDKDAGWRLVEVKSSSRPKREHLPDVAFQKLVFERAGIPITDVSVIHLNRFYRRNGALDPKRLLRETAVNAKVRSLEKRTAKLAAAAYENLTSRVEPTTCACIRKHRWEHCPTFRHFHPNVPEYSIFHVSGIGKRTIKELVDRSAFEVTDIPDGVKLSEKGKAQVLVAREGKPIVKEGAIRKFLDRLTFPLHFLDYETTFTAIPPFDGIRPYDTMPFQYSLHVLADPEAEPVHHGYLATNETADPVTELLTKLRADVGERGSILIWSKFEIGCHEGMAKLRPEFAEFLAGLNRRAVDLMEVFSDRHYLHPDFRGSASIKKVLPVLVPDLSYADLGIAEGSWASAHWEDALAEDFDPKRRAEIYRDLERYCALDTLAMVRIYQHLRERCARPPGAGQASK